MLVAEPGSRVHAHRARRGSVVPVVFTGRGMWLMATWH